jgi:predicted transcriptional regulator
MLIYEEEKNYEIVINDFFKIIKVFNNKLNPLIFSDDTHINKILKAMENLKDTTTKDIAKYLDWNFKGIGYWLNLIYKFGLCNWKFDGKRKVWKLTKRGLEFIKIYRRITYPKSRFMIVIRLSLNQSIKDMASILGYSKEHYERIEKRGYPWSYRKAESIFKNLNKKKVIVKKELVLKRLKKWLIDKRLEFIKTRARNSNYLFLEKLIPTSGEKKLIGILESIDLKRNKDFFVHKTCSKYNIDIILKRPRLFIEVVKPTKNCEKTFLAMEIALSHLTSATKNVNSRIMVIDNQNNLINPECVDLVKGKAIVFFLYTPIRESYISYLKFLSKVRTIPELRERFKHPTETIRSRLKFLLKVGLIKRVDNFRWKITTEGRKIVNSLDIFLAKNCQFLKTRNKTLLNKNIAFLNKIVEIKRRTYNYFSLDPFVNEVNKMLAANGIHTKIHQKISIGSTSKFPDIIAEWNKKKFIIECIRTKENSLYTQATRLAYKIKILRRYLKNNNFVFIGVISCYDSPLLFVPPNKPFRLLKKLCDKLFIDSNLKEIIEFIKSD